MCLLMKCVAHMEHQKILKNIMVRLLHHDIFVISKWKKRNAKSSLSCTKRVFDRTLFAIIQLKDYLHGFLSGEENFFSVYFTFQAISR